MLTVKRTNEDVHNTYRVARKYAGQFVTKMPTKSIGSFSARASCQAFCTRATKFLEKQEVILHFN